MKHLYPYLLKLTTLSIIILLLAPTQRLQAQACATAQGNQTTYGTNNVWIGYVYTGSINIFCRGRVCHCYLNFLSRCVAENNIECYVTDRK